MPSTRVTLCLPVNTPAEVSAAIVVTSDILRQLGGITFSQLSEPVFTCYWNEGDTTYRDRISFVIGDMQQEMSSDEVLGRLVELRELILRAYREVGSPQLESWVVASPTMIVLGDVLSG